MSLTSANELIIRKALATTAGTVAEAGYIKPAAQYFSGIEEAWATFDQTKDSRDEIETSLIAATWIYPVNFLDDLTSGGLDSPLVNLRYEFYLFRQYGVIRADESATPDIFDSKVLVQHNDFIAGWLGLKEAFQGNRNIAGLDAEEFATVQTTSLVQIDDIANQVICEFIPGIVGYAVRLQTSVRIKLRDC